MFAAEPKGFAAEEKGHDRPLRRTAGFVHQERASLNHGTLHVPKLHVTHLEAEGFFGNAQEGS